jgi:hypothetical protein
MSAYIFGRVRRACLTGFLPAHLYSALYRVLQKHGFSKAWAAVQCRLLHDAAALAQVARMDRTIPNTPPTDIRWQISYWQTHCFSWGPKTALEPEDTLADRYRRDCLDMVLGPDDEGGKVDEPPAVPTGTGETPPPPPAAGTARTPRKRRKPGPKGYPQELREYALKLRRENPRMTTNDIRDECVKHFPAIDVPDNEEGAFRRRLNCWQKKLEEEQEAGS